MFVIFVDGNVQKLLLQVIAQMTFEQLSVLFDLEHIVLSIPLKGFSSDNVLVKFM